MEVRNLASVSAIGIDKRPSGEMEVTMVIPEATSLFPNTNIPGLPHSTIVTGTGKNISEAISHMASGIAEKLYFGHMETVVFGERAAAEEMPASLDFLRRGREFRPNINVLVTRESVKKVMKAPPQKNPTFGLAMYNLIRANRLAPTTMVRDVSQFTQDLSNNQSDPFTGVIAQAKEHGIDMDEGSAQTTAPAQTQNGNDSRGNDKNKPDSLSLKGTAVFKNGHLAGFLDKPETRGLLWLRGKLKNEVVVLDCGNGGTAALKVMHSESSLSPTISNGNIHMKAMIKTKGDINQLTCSNVKTDPAQITALEQQLEQKMRQEVTTVLNKAKNDWQADIFGFGRAIYRNNPKEWNNNIAPDWRNGLLKNMNIDLDISANIERHGLLKDQNRVNESR